jgi:hypothetical protein
MKVYDWLTNCLSNRTKALSLYKRGMKKATKRDHQGAIADYTATIGLPDTPADVIAMVLYNRALVYVATGEDRKGAEDLEAVLAMKEGLVNVKTMARQKLARMESRSSKSHA